MKKVAEYLLIFIAIQFVSITLANGALLLTGGQIGSKLAETAIAMNIAAFIIVVAVFVVWLRTITFTNQYIKTKPYVQILLCVILGFATIPPSVFLQDMLSDITDTNEELFKSMISQPMGFVALTLLGPVTEEIVFRGAILKQLSLSLSNHWKAIIIAALLFAVIHFNPAQFVHAFLIGMLLGWICIKTRSIIPCILIHIINNCTVFIMIKYYPEISLTSYTFIIVSVIFIIISLWGIVKTEHKQ